MKPNCFYFDKLHCFLLKSSAKPQFSWADLAKNSIFAKGKTSLQRGVENFLIRHDLGFSKRQKKRFKWVTIFVKLFFLRRVTIFLLIWAKYLQCDNFMKDGHQYWSATRFLQMETNVSKSATLLIYLINKMEQECSFFLFYKADKFRGRRY